MRLRWTHRARRDLVDIGRYIARDKPMAARRWVARLRQRAREASQIPKAGRKVPETNREDVREVLPIGGADGRCVAPPRSPRGDDMVRAYRIVYLVCDSDSEIRVLTVFDGHKMLSQEIIDSLS